MFTFPAGKMTWTRSHRINSQPERQKYLRRIIDYDGNWICNNSARHTVTICVQQHCKFVACSYLSKFNPNNTAIPSYLIFHIIVWKWCERSCFLRKNCHQRRPSTAIFPQRAAPHTSLWHYNVKYQITRNSRIK